MFYSPLYKYTIFLLSVHQLIDVYAVSIFCVLQIDQQRTWMSKYLCGGRRDLGEDAQE